MLNKKNALITGAAGLLGFQHALALNELGFNIILIDIDKKNLLLIHNKLKKRIKKNTAIHSYLCDISSESQVKKVSLELKKKKLLIDVLINNADVNPQMDKYKGSFTGRVEDYSIENLTKELKVGIIGTFICSKVFGEHMKIKKKGSIINISSSSAIEANEGRSAYSASKSALTILSKSIAREMGSSNIRINTIAPGLTDTDMMRNNTPEKIFNTTIERLSIKRVGKKEEIANAALFLASDLSSYITGQTLSVDGGM